MQHDGLESILAKIEEERRDQAREDLRPYLLGAQEAPPAEICYVLGRSFFGVDNSTARYLFEAALSADPNFREAGEYEARCGSGLHDLETFNDEHHPPCEACHLRFRESEPQCPYCGAWPDSAEEERVKESSFQSQFRIAREEMKESFHKLTDKEELKRAREKAEAMGKDAYRRAKEFREREDVKDSLDKASATTQNFMGKAQDYVRYEQHRFNQGDTTSRAKILGKWFVIGLVVLWILKWLFG